MFLDFVNFYIRFVRNCSGITALLISMLQITDNKALSTQTIENNRNQDASASNSGVGSSDTSGRVGGSIENLSIVTKWAKSKKRKLIKIKKSDFAKANSSKADFLILKAKKVFTHLQKVFNKTPILQHFDLECYIYMEIDASGYAISRILNQMTSEQPLSNHVTYKNHSDFLKSKISE